MVIYYKLYQESKEKIVGLRVNMVEYALEYTISAAAKKFKTSRKTVSKWVHRYDSSKGFSSLDDHSKKPNTSSPKLSDDWLKKLKDKCNLLKTHAKKIVGSYILFDLKLPISLPTVLKYIKGLGFKKEKISKKEKKRNLQELKQKYQPFEKIQVDIKYLDDIPEFLKEYYLYNIPRYQITARCIKTGTLFFGYAKEKTPLNTAIFMKKLLTHLENNHINVKQIVTVQTDNGREFKNLQGEKSTKFKDIVLGFGAKYKSIPPRAKTWQSDVETSHRLIEDEFYGYQIFYSRNDFFEKAYKYQYEFNTLRKNTYKDNKTPLDILKESFKNKNIDNLEEIYNFKIEVMDEHIRTVVDL